MTLRGIRWVSVSTTAQAEDDKTSIPTQLDEQERWARANNVQIVDTLIVPGHSRRYTDIHECSRDMLREGIDAFDKLIKHWQTKDFDVLIVRDGNRFARTQTLHARVVEDTIAIGARLYSLTDGWVDEVNYRLFIAMNGYMAASYVDHLVKGAKKTKSAKTAQGIPTGSQLVYSHKAIRNTYGSVIAFPVDEDKRRLFDDIKTLLVKEKVGWKDIELELFERFGHGRNGKPFARFFVYHMIFNPWFWGNPARRYKDITLGNGQKTDLWVFDSSVPVPQGVEIHYGKGEAVYKGEEAEEVKAELRRRRMVIRGTARPKRTQRFSGLLICEYCGFRLTFFRDRKYNSHTYACRSKQQARPGRPGCSKSRHVKQHVVQDWIDRLLRVALETDEPFIFDESEHDENARIMSLNQEIASIENQVRRLITQQATAPEAVTTLYEEQIQAFGEQLKVLRQTLLQAERRHEGDKEEQKARALALGEIEEFEDLEQFWWQPEVKINAWLHRFFGRWRIRVQDQKVVGVVKTA